MTDQRTRTIDVGRATAALLDGLRQRDWGQVSPSVYETGQLVRLAPWLTGHRDRIDFLLATQRPAGGWGFGDSYAIVPTLSATAALLASGLGDQARLLAAASHGLLAARRQLAAARPSIPDMPAIEIIIPALVEEINVLAEKADLAPLPLPAGVDHRKLTWFRTLLAEGRPVPTKLWHALEVAGASSRRSPAIAPAENGSIGASPAATAAWLGGEEDGPSLSFLRAAAGADGLVPCATPITVFERAWVLGTLTRAGVPVRAADDLVDSLASALTGLGAATAPGLPPDADTTSMALYALTRLGHPQDSRCLWRYRTSTHFCTWQGEEGVSTTVNAHVLEALGAAPAGARPHPTMAALATWLRDQQRPDGSWVDRWHASPYYATAACALALHQYGGPASAVAVRRAVDWALATQRDDGSWGRWEGSPEETAYAVHVLVLTGARDVQALFAGHRFLVEALGDRADPPALWHDKDLYAPTAIVAAAVIAAIQLAQHRLPGLSQDAKRSVNPRTTPSTMGRVDEPHSQSVADTQRLSDATERC